MLKSVFEYFPRIILFLHDNMYQIQIDFLSKDCDGFLFHLPKKKNA